MSSNAKNVSRSVNTSADDNAEFKTKNFRPANKPNLRKLFNFETLAYLIVNQCWTRLCTPETSAKTEVSPVKQQQEQGTVRKL